MPADALPKLGRREMARLVEVATTTDNYEQSKPVTTDALVLSGLLERFRRAGSRRVRPTPLGIRILAGLPGDEFDRFREMLDARPD